MQSLGFPSDDSDSDFEYGHPCHGCQARDNEMETLRVELDSVRLELKSFKDKCDKVQKRDDDEIEFNFRMWQLTLSFLIPFMIIQNFIIH